MGKGYRYAAQQDFAQSLKTLTWEQFPAILERSITYFATLPRVGTYQHVKPDVKEFKEALLDTTGRQFTMSGIGSLINYDEFGHQIKRPIPQLQGTACSGNSLCIDPTCFGFQEGVIESNNMIQNICWSLSMPCLKDYYYSDMQFDRKLKQYFAMFFRQPHGVLQAYQRTNLLKESIKVVATDENFRFTGAFGGDSGLSLPFYISPNDPTNFPNTGEFASGIGGFNMAAFRKFVAPRLFSGSFSNGMEGVKVYSLEVDYYTAKEQTATVIDSYMDQELLYALRSRGMQSPDMDMLDRMMGSWTEDKSFPTFKEDTNGDIIPIPQEHLEASTLIGYEQKTNPEHALAEIRGMLFVPDNWMYELVEPPIDDFSYLGLGGLNFKTGTPGVERVMSSSMFTNNRILAEDGVVRLGYTINGGELQQTVKGVGPRDKKIMEAIRTDIIKTYSSIECNNAAEGQLSNVGPAMVPQGVADGFRLKSTMYIGSAIKGTAKPVLVLFKTDTPRSAKPISVCNVNEVVVSQSGAAKLVSCCPGGQIYVVLTFDRDVSADFSVDDEAIYRQGPKGASYEVTVTAVSGNVVTVQSTDGTTLIPCCSGASDDYGTQGELLNVTTATATSSEIFKAEYDSGSSSIFLEFFDPLVANLATTAGTITLKNGQVINVQLVADAAGVFAQVEAAGGETCDLSTLDCACLINAVFSY